MPQPKMWCMIATVQYPGKSSFIPLIVFFNKCCPGRYSKPIFPNPYVVVNSFTLTPQVVVTLNKPQVKELNPGHLKTANVSFFNHEAKPGKNHQIRADEFSGGQWLPSQWKMCVQKSWDTQDPYFEPNMCCLAKGRILGAPTVETSSFGRSQMQFFKLNDSTYEDEFEIFSPAMEFSFCFHIQNFVKNTSKNTFTILAYHASCQQNLTRNLDRWQQLASPTKLLRMVGRTQALYPKIGGAVKSQTPKKKTLAIFSDHTKLPFLWG